MVEADVRRITGQVNHDPPRAVDYPGKELGAVPPPCDNAGRGLLWGPSFRQVNDLPRALSVRHLPCLGQRRGFFSEDDMRNTTTTVAIAAGAVLAAVIVTPTESDDGDTGIQDFLTLLGGWGACPCSLV